jgi:hypothetical protein
MRSWSCATTRAYVVGLNPVQLADGLVLPGDIDVAVAAWVALRGKSSVQIQGPGMHSSGPWPKLNATTRSSFHPIPAALTVPYSLGEYRIARRLAVGL